MAGSPPRVRGKREHGILGELRRGITPACAGKTWATRRREHPDRDHPRVCGENTVSPILSAAARGSPPRVRGKLFPFNSHLLPPGITPACAGKTMW